MNISQQNEEEKKLLSRVCSGDDTGFWELWEQHKNALFLKCRRMMNDDTDDAEDALSMAMLHAHQKLPRYASEVTNFKSWALRLTENLCIDWLRKRKRQISFDDRLISPGLADELLDNGEINTESAEDRHQREEMMTAVFDQVKKLPMRLQEPAILRFFMRMPHKDIADKLQLTGDTVRKRIQQARERLNGRLVGVVAMLSRWNFNGNGSIGESPVFNAIKEEADRILNRRIPEITAAFSATRVIKISLPSGQKQTIPVFLPAPVLQRKIKTSTLKDYIDRYPGGWRKRLQLAEILYANGNWEQAAFQFSRVVEKHPHNLSASLILGQMLLRTGREQEALNVYREAVQYVKNESTRHFLSGMMDWCRRQMDRALVTFGKAAELEPWNEIFLRFQALTHLQAKRPIKALKSFEAALDVNPYDLVSLTYGYELLVEFGCLQKAEEYVNRVLEAYPTDMLALKRKIKIRCRKGLVYGSEGKITRNSIRRLKQLAPDLPMASEAETVYHFYRGEWTKALTPLELSAKQGKNRGDAWYAYCLWLFRTGYYDTAARLVLKRCAKLYNGETETRPTPAFYLLACDILAETGSKENLEEVIRHMLDLFPGDWQVELKAGYILAVYFKEFTRAQALARGVCRSQSGITESHFVYAQVLMASGDFSAARDVVKRGWSLLPRDHFCAPACEGARLMARCYRETGDAPNERKWLHILLDDAGHLEIQRPAFGLYYRGIALQALGRQEEARKDFRGALEAQLPYPQRKEAKKFLRGI